MANEKNKQQSKPFEQPTRVDELKDGYQYNGEGDANDPRNAQAKVPEMTSAVDDESTTDSALPYAYTAKGIQERIEGKPQATPGLHVITDAYTQVLRAGRNINNEIVAPYREDNPEMEFRGLTKEQIKQHGWRGWQQLVDPQTRKNVYALNEDRPIGFKPKEEARKVRRGYQDKANLARRQARERMVDQGLRAERDSGGAVRMQRDGETMRGMRDDSQESIMGVPIGSTTRRGHSILD